MNITLQTYARKPAQAKNGSHRAYLIFKLQRDWPALRLGLKNGRSLNRLSTKQLEAKVRQCERMLAAARERYVESLHSPARQQHLVRFLAAHKISLLNTFHLAQTA